MLPEGRSRPAQKTVGARLRAAEEVTGAGVVGQGASLAASGLCRRRDDAAPASCRRSPRRAFRRASRARSTRSSETAAASCLRTRRSKVCSTSWLRRSPLLRRQSQQTFNPSPQPSSAHTALPHPGVRIGLQNSVQGTVHILSNGPHAAPSLSKRAGMQLSPYLQSASVLHAAPRVSHSPPSSPKLPRLLVHETAAMSGGVAAVTSVFHDKATIERSTVREYAMPQRQPPPSGPGAYTANCRGNVNGRQICP